MRRWVITGIGAVIITAAIGGAIAFASKDSEGGVTDDRLIEPSTPLSRRPEAERPTPSSATRRTGGSGKSRSGSQMERSWMSD